jgi:two-component system, OmpR family, response regulator RegX3
MHIAILEDDLPQAKLLEHWLLDSGMSCALYATGAAFRAGIVTHAADLILLDWMLPDDDGLAVLIWLRETLDKQLPVMFTTTRAEEDSLVMALDRGADDYLIKPLRRAETLARIQALMRRGTGGKPPAMVKLGGVQIDIDKHRAVSHGVPVELTDRELDLAVYMLRNHGRLLTRQELLENVWRTSPDIITRTVDTHISRLRAKLALTPENGFDLSTVYHKGYRLEFRAPGEAAG